MKRRFTYAAVGGLLFTLGCSAKVEIGRGTAASGAASGADDGESGARGNPVPEGGSSAQNGGETAIGGFIETGGSVSSGGSASTIFDPAHDPAIVGAAG